MNHSHSCSCEHLSVKYCPHCKVVYCESCSQEWTTKRNDYWYPYITYTGRSYGTSNTDLKGQVLCNDNSVNDGHTIVCKHNH